MGAGLVSTHSRPKAAVCHFDSVYFDCCFNTQPPEGGCGAKSLKNGATKGFNTQPPEGGWKISGRRLNGLGFQHTAARRRLKTKKSNTSTKPMFQHTAARRRLFFRFMLIGTNNGFQHTAARRRLDANDAKVIINIVSTHSRPKAAVCVVRLWLGSSTVSTHSRPKAAEAAAFGGGWSTQFQHTAARRRLKKALTAARWIACFNTQPPEGGWRLRLVY